MRRRPGATQLVPTEGPHPARPPLIRSRRRLARASLCLGFVLVECIPAYAPPTSNMPHGLLKFRTRYGAMLGPTLSESLSIDGRPALSREIPGWDSLVPSTEVLLVHPGPLLLGANASFWHLERDPGYPMGYCGGPRFFASCYSPNRTVRVVDANCSRSLQLEVRAGDVYLIELDFVDASACRLVCYRQRSLRQGRVQMLPCLDQSP